MGALWVLEGRAVVEFTCCETEDGVRRWIWKLGYFGIFLGFLVARFRGSNLHLLLYTILLIAHSHVTHW